MPEEATRRLLKLFGIALTDLEDLTKTALESLPAHGPRPEGAAAPLELSEQWLKASGEAMARWLEVTQWLVETQARGRAGLLRAIGAARQSLG
ncbi:MAG TPA: hypothetical protein VLG48_09545 [Candidatus Methylomirabilis sp.]|nr:hypothetical protein [Candidatus Methylomirabilis sp.]